MLVGKILSYFIYIVLSVDVIEGGKQVATLELSERDFSVIFSVYQVKYSVNHGIS
jgi:hypothetical protein